MRPCPNDLIPGCWPSSILGQISNNNIVTQKKKTLLLISQLFNSTFFFLVFLNLSFSSPINFPIWKTPTWQPPLSAKKNTWQPPPIQILIVCVCFKEKPNFDQVWSPLSIYCPTSLPTFLFWSFFFYLSPLNIVRYPDSSTLPCYWDCTVSFRVHITPSLFLINLQSPWVFLLPFPRVSSCSDCGFDFYCIYNLV